MTGSGGAFYGYSAKNRGVGHRAGGENQPRRTGGSALQSAVRGRTAGGRNHLPHRVRGQAIQAARSALPDMLLGAGTVLTTSQVQSAMEAGAQFIVTPGFNPEVVDFCLEKGIAVFPGCPTTSDMEQAIARGLKVVKFFPAEAMGGLKFIKAVSAPYGQLKFMPTGGVNESNLIDYLAFDKVVACGGSWMVPGDLVEKGAFDEIERLTRSAVQKMLGFEIKHVGVNTESPAAGLGRGQAV